MTEKNTPTLFKKHYLEFLFSSNFLVVYLLTLSQIIITGMLKMLNKTTSYDDLETLRYALLSFVVAVVTSSIVKVFCYFHMGHQFKLIKDTSLKKYTFRTFGEWMITEVRIQFRVLIGLILFIIPGVVEALRLSLSLPIVFLDEEKMKDKTFDPVYASRDFLNLNNKNLFSLAFIIIVLPLVLFLMSDQESSFFDTNLTMIKGLLTALFISLATVFSYLYLIFLYCDYSNTQPQNQGDL